MKQWLGAILALLLAVVLVNDVSRLASAHYSTEQLAIVAADEALIAVRNDPADEVAGYERAQQFAESEGANVYGYTQEDGVVKVWLEAPLESTIVLGPLLSLWEDEGYGSPVMIRKQGQRRL
jgi:hypothetical protein